MPNGMPLVGQLLFTVLTDDSVGVVMIWDSTYGYGALLCPATMTTMEPLVMVVDITSRVAVTCDTGADTNELSPRIRPADGVCPNDRPLRTTSIVGPVPYIVAMDSDSMVGGSYLQPDNNARVTSPAAARTRAMSAANPLRGR